MTIPAGFRPESDRISDGIPPDSALNTASKNRESTSSRTDAPSRAREESLTSRIRRITEADALTRLVAAIRPEWPIADVHAWALRDPRPTADVIAAGINGARDRNIRQVGGLQFAGPAAATAAMTYPSAREALAANEPEALDDHGFPPGRCPICRHGVAPEEDR